jgi:hypothetical protein
LYRFLRLSAVLYPADFVVRSLVPGHIRAWGVIPNSTPENRRKPMIAKGLRQERLVVTTSAQIGSSAEGPYLASGRSAKSYFPRLTASLSNAGRLGATSGAACPDYRSFSPSSATKCVVAGRAPSGQGEMPVGSKPAHPLS